MNVQLKETLLEKAIHGELIPNDKKLKPIDVESILEDIPYEIPENWKWTLFQDIAIIVRGSSPRPIKEYLTKSPKGIHWIKIGDAKPNEYYINQTKEKITEEGKKKSRYVEKGSLLLSNSMSYGRPYILNVSGCIHDGWLNIKKKEEYFDIKYMMYILSSKYFYTIMSEKSVGSVVNNLNIEKVKSLKIPLPPIEEQKRIVEKLEECFELIDQKERNDQEQERLKLLLKEILLEKAIHGELVPNDKNLKPIDVENILDDVPYPIPENWRWTEMFQCYVFKQGIQIEIEKQSNEISEKYPLPFLRIVDFTQENQDKRYVGKEYSTYVIEKNEIVIVRYGASAGFIGLGKKGVLANNLFKLIPQVEMNEKYMYYLLKSSYYQKKIRTHSVGIPAIKFSSLNKIPIPIPPIEEQKRIVEKLEECFVLVERL